jgi:hypothetical protein
MLLKRLLLSTIVLSSFLFSKSSIGVNVNSDDVEFNGSYSLNEYYQGAIEYHAEVSYLYNSEKNDLVSFGINGEAALESAPGLIFGFGFEGVYTDDFMAIPLLGKVRYILPFDSDIPTTSLLLSYSYAPSGLTFSDGSSYSNLKMEANVELIPSLNIFTGYRNIDTDYEYRDYELNDSFYGGLKFSF